MHIGVPKEIKIHESRVGLTPAAVRELVANGHHVMVQKNAGLQIDLSDEKYLGVTVGRDWTILPEGETTADELPPAAIEKL